MENGKCTQYTCECVPICPQNQNAPPVISGYQQPEFGVKPGPFSCLNCRYATGNGRVCNFPGWIQLGTREPPYNVTPAGCCDDFVDKTGRVECGAPDNWKLRVIQDYYKRRGRRS